MSKDGGGNEETSRHAALGAAWAAKTIDALVQITDPPSLQRERLKHALNPETLNPEIPRTQVPILTTVHPGPVA